MKYRAVMSISVDAPSDEEARKAVKKLVAMLKSPMVRLAVEAEGIRLVGGNGEPTVQALQREAFDRRA